MKKKIINHNLAQIDKYFWRNIALKYLTKNKRFLENYLGKIYNN